MPVNRYYSSIAQDTSLTGNITSGSGNMAVASTTGFPTSYPFTLAVDYDTASEELVSVTGAAGLTLNITRGIDGTSPQSHTVGAVVRHVISAQDLREPQQHMAASSGVHGVTGSVIGTSDYTAKGVILVGTTGSAKTPLTVGSNGQVLIADSAETAGVKWGAVSTTPRIAQVVVGSTTSTTASTSGTYVDISGLTVTITPTSSTSKIFITTSFGVVSSGGSSTYSGGYFRLVRNSTEISESSWNWYKGGVTFTDVVEYLPVGLSYVDSPATTSATTYKMQLQNPFSIYNVSANPLAKTVQIIAMEILV